MRPGWLPNRLPGKELDHDGLDVDYGCSVDGVEFGDEEPGAFHPDDTADRAPDAIGPVLATLRKNANAGPVFVVSWVTCADDAIRFDFMENVQDFSVREVRDSMKCFSGEPPGEAYRGFLSTPEVVFGVTANRFDETNGLNASDHGNIFAGTKYR